MTETLKKQSPARLISAGFLALILIGSLLLVMPFSIKPGIELDYIDALYTSVSAVCVTGLVSVSTADTFSGFGQAVIAALIQIGGLGVAVIGVGIFLALKKRVNLKGCSLIKSAININSGNGLVRLVREIFIFTFFAELVGALLCWPVFARHFSPLKALWVSVFHSVASFNNAGFDILGGFNSLVPYRGSLALILTTSALIIIGGIGFPVLQELREARKNRRRLSLHSMAVLQTTAFLLVFGTLMLLLTENMSFFDTFFHSVSARTAGFASCPVSELSLPGLLTISLLMLIGASPGSTGGGIKTTTFFVLMLGIRSAATNRSEKAFRMALPKDSFKKAAIILLLSLCVIFSGTYLISVLEPELGLTDIFFESISAFATVGLSTGITPSLGVGAKIISMIIMYIGRLGPLTVATLWSFSGSELASRPEGNISIG